MRRLDPACSNTLFLGIGFDQFEIGWQRGRLERGRCGRNYGCRWLNLDYFFREKLRSFRQRCISSSRGGRDGSRERRRLVLDVTYVVLHLSRLRRLLRGFGGCGLILARVVTVATATSAATTATFAIRTQCLLARWLRVDTSLDRRRFRPR